MMVNYGLGDFIQERSIAGTSLTPKSVHNQLIPTYICTHIVFMSEIWAIYRFICVRIPSPGASLVLLVFLVVDKIIH